MRRRNRLLCEYDEVNFVLDKEGIVLDTKSVAEENVCGELGHAPNFGVKLLKTLEILPIDHLIKLIL